MEQTSHRTTHWYKEAIFYELYVRAFMDSDGDGIGDLRGITQRLDYLQWLGVDCIWLLPIYPSPLKDDGYDISDYCGIHPDYGTLDDLRELVEQVHKRGMRIILDLVINHTSDQHPWFQMARADPNSPYRDYYVWSDTDQKYTQARVIFIDSEKSNWSWDEKAGQYYWHRFYRTQPDLNYDNPRVRAEILNVMRFWLDIGIDGFRVDAVPYLFEREGTNCENLPETHEFLREMRAFVDREYPHCLLLCEANQRPSDLRHYFGGDLSNSSRPGDEFHMGFNFPLMPRLFMALKKGESEDLLKVLTSTPALPQNCQWGVFLRCHDELTLEMVSEEERQWMWENYAPDKQMRLNLGIRRRLAPLLDNDLRKILLAHSLLLTLPGSPFLYYGDEIGMGDRVDLADRNGLRTPMQWDDSLYAGFSTVTPFAPFPEGDFSPQKVNVAEQMRDPNSLINQLRKMIVLRKRISIFGNGEFEWVKCDNPHLAVYWRKTQEKEVLVVNNLSDQPQKMRLPVETLRWQDWLTKLTIRGAELTLPPFGFLWLQPFGEQ
ncbi:MAG: hypothetical protein Kow0088_01710 [Anaerolineales bacterium]